MGLKYAIHQVDQNQRIIVQALEAGGCVVTSIGRPVDLLIARHRRNHIAEVKTAKGKLRPSQAKFIASWPAPVWILRSVDDVIDFLRETD